MFKSCFIAAKCCKNDHCVITRISKQVRSRAAVLGQSLMVNTGGYSQLTYLLAKLMVEMRRGSVQTMLHDAPRPASRCSYSIE